MNLQQFFSNEGYDISEKLNWEKYIDIWSSWYLLFNEKVSINLQKDEDTKALNDILRQNNAEVIINQGLEKSFAIGTGALVVSVQDIEQEENILDVTNAKIKLEFVECKKIIPLTWENGKIIECAFVTTKHKKGQTYIYIAMHVLS